MVPRRRGPAPRSARARPPGGPYRRDLPAPVPGAVDLLARGVGRGATIVAIGPLTNLAALERERPGALAGVPVVATGGWVHAPDPGFPAWGPDGDWNVACDTGAARVVAGVADLTLCQLWPTMRAAVRRADLPRPSAAGPMGALLARQCAAYAEDEGLTALGRSHAGLPDDLLNFLWDPVACAVAAGWAGARTERVALRTVLDGSTLRFEPDAAGRPTGLLVDLDATGFTDVWIDAVRAAGRAG